jgi:hypothetical protein
MFPWVLLDFTQRLATDRDTCSPREPLSFNIRLPCFKGAGDGGQSAHDADLWSRASHGKYQQAGKERGVSALAGDSLWRA